MVNTCALLAMVAAAALLVWSGLCAWRGPLGPDLNLVKQWNLAEFIATMRTGIDPNGQELSKQCHGVRSDEWMMRNSPPSMNI